MKNFRKIAFGVCLFAYPVFIFFSIVVYDISMKTVGLGMLIIAVCAFFFSSGKGRMTPVVMGSAAVFFLLTKTEAVIRLYPVWITSAMIWIFLAPLLKGESIIYTFATIADKAVKIHPGSDEIKSYCKKWNIAWLCFFCFSETINLCLVFMGSSRLWAIYNGLVTYLLQGLMFVLQFSINFFFNRKLDRRYCFDRKAARKCDVAIKEEEK